MLRAKGLLPSRQLAPSQPWASHTRAHGDSRCLSDTWTSPQAVAFLQWGPATGPPPAGPAHCPQAHLGQVEQRLRVLGPAGRETVPASGATGAAGQRMAELQEGAGPAAQPRVLRWRPGQDLAPPGLQGPWHQAALRTSGARWCQALGHHQGSAQFHSPSERLGMWPAAQETPPPFQSSGPGRSLGQREGQLEQ